ncbi:winged helix-turn-helix domain-containing protein [Candidatus Riflebacteria bacterium]
MKELIKKMKNGLAPCCKLWLSSDGLKSAFGGGKFRILQAIDEKGSLRGACTLLGISYRKAWGDLKQAEKGLGLSLVVRSRGGNYGGGTYLTCEGKQILKAYSAFHREVKKKIKKSFEKHFGGPQ